jgi:hypothetical protein
MKREICELKAQQSAHYPKPATDRYHWVLLSSWLDEIGTSSVTAWRWRTRGWLNTVNIGGRLFLRPEDRAEFERRAAAGEFARPPAGAAGASHANVKKPA